MNKRIAIDRNESNPMLLGYMEIVQEDGQNLRQKQKELNQAMMDNAEISGMIAQHKKEAEELQIGHQKKISEMMAENPEIIALMEEHKKEVEELKNRQRMAVEELMKKDEDIIEMMKQQNKEMQNLSMTQQQQLNQEMNANPAMETYIAAIKEARQMMQENQQMFEQEMLKGIYMTPIMITPEPVKDEDGNYQMAPNTQIGIQGMQFRNLNLLMAFTDAMELKKWDKSEGMHTLSLGMVELMTAALKDPKVNGITLNPYGANIVIPKERMEMMLRAAAGQGAGAKNTKVVEANLNE